MTRPTSLVLLGLAAFLVLFPLTLEKPGWPPGLKADEPAYYLMALSLAHDGDVRLDLGDLRRLVDEFPDHPARNVILMSDDGWHTVYFGKPYLYSLFAAPLARVFGANGLVAFNMLLYLGMIALGARYLRRANTDGVALFFAAGFFFLSAGFAYVFWIQPEVFNMAAIMASLYLGLTSPSAPRFRRGRLLREGLQAWLDRPTTRLFAAGALLLLAGYNKPMLVAMGLPVAFVAWRRPRRWRALGAFLLGGTLSLAAAVGGALALTGHPSAYLGVARAGVKICSPHEMPIQPVAPPPADAAAPEKGSLAEPRRASWSWLLRLPRFHPPEVAEHLGYFLWGRHTGLFVYFPFSLLALGLFLAHARRCAVRWVLLAALVAVALFFLLWIPFNWHGGGGFVGNRYFVNVYPGFLFLVGRVAPAWIQLLGWAAGGLCLGPILFTPLGRTVPWPTLQAHVRNFPYPHLPLELGVKGIPGYHEAHWAGARLRGRKDVFLPRGHHAWVGGATTTELWIQSPRPLADLHFRVASFAAPNELTLQLGDATETLRVDEPGRRHRVHLVPSGPSRTLSRHGGQLYLYRLALTARTGEVREWTQHYPPRDCFYHPWPETTLETFYAGAELTYLGTSERVERDLWAVEWGAAKVPRRLAAGQVVTVRARVRNASGAVWPAAPPTRVSLAHRWEDDTGKVVVPNGPRTPLERPAAPGELVELSPSITAPSQPGRYVLVFDLVYEGVAWFSDRNGGVVLRQPVEVLPPR